MAISLGPTARPMPAWGNAPGIKTHKLFRSANGAVHRCERGCVRRHGEARDRDMAISSGPTARLIPAWGVAPGIKTRKLFPSANGAVHRCERGCVRRHGNGAGFQPWLCFWIFSWGLAPGWDDDAPLALCFRATGRCQPGPNALVQGPWNYRGLRVTCMTTRLRDCDMAISSGPTARLIPAWGIAPGIKTHKLFPSANGAIHRCERGCVRWHGEVQGLWHGDKFRANGPADTSLGHRPRNQDPQIVPQRQRRVSSARKVLGAAAWRGQGS
jgi:hypothetical protein